MPDYIDGYEEIFNRLAAMQSHVSEEMQIAMLLASFGDKSQSQYGHIVTSLQTVQDELKWETVSARLLQEYDELSSRSSSSRTQVKKNSLALAVFGRPKRRHEAARHHSRNEKRRCFKCNRIGHIARNCKYGGKQLLRHQEVIRY